MTECEFPIDKRKWSPSLIPGPIVLVATISREGVPNVAPKSWVQMVAFEPSILMFSGQEGNPTENNIEQTRCFAVNVVDESMLAGVVNCLQWKGTQRIEESGWTLEPGRRIAAPVVAECPAHLECELERTVTMGSALVVFGRIVDARIGRRIAQAPPHERYRLLKQACFLEDGLYTVIQETVWLGRKEAQA